jgi:Leucine-rich repeat
VQHFSTSSNVPQSVQLTAYEKSVQRRFLRRRVAELEYICGKWSPCNPPEFDAADHLIKAPTAEKRAQARTFELYKMVRLTVDLVASAPSRVNPCMERELVLRGLKIPAIENLGGAMVSSRRQCGKP